MSPRRTPDGPQAPPPVQRLRIRYAKRGRLRFSSTRDFQRALERALRRTAVPMAFSSGFHPHPRISYANAAPTGMASEAEYVEIAVVEHLDPEKVRVALDAALPDGIDVLDVVEAGAGSLADRLEASLWELRFRELRATELQDAVDAFLGRDAVEVTRMTKNGPRTFDTRQAVLSAVVTSADDPPCAILQVVVRHATPAVRPDDVLTAIRTASGVDLAPHLVQRLAQGPLTTNPVGVGDPLSTGR